MKTIAQQLNINDFPFQIRDKFGRPIYCEYPDNTWWRSEYDSNGYEKYFETSEGYSAKYKYDSDGNQIYFEDSDGIIINNRLNKPQNNKKINDKYIAQKT